MTHYTMYAKSNTTDVDKEVTKDWEEFLQNNTDFIHPFDFVKVCFIFLPCLWFLWITLFQRRYIDLQLLHHNCPLSYFLAFLKYFLLANKIMTQSQANPLNLCYVNSDICFGLVFVAGRISCELQNLYEAYVSNKNMCTNIISIIIILCVFRSVDQLFIIRLFMVW